MKLFRTILTLSLVLLVLVSSSNFMIGIHVCADEVRNIGFLGKAEVCEMELKLPACHRHMTAPCCDDETIVHEAQDLKSVTHVDLTTAPAIDIHWVRVLIAEVIPAAPFSRTLYSPYDPPLLPSDITVTNQVFRI